MNNTCRIIRLGQASNSGSQAGMIYSTSGLFPTVCACTHGYALGYILDTEVGKVNKIIREIIPLQVKVRKYDVDIEGLKELLKESKKKLNLTTKAIAAALGKPLTLVEHWFRNDKYFAIPDDDIWFELKELLDITDETFDESVMTFEIRDGAYDKSNRVYSSEGIAPTLTCIGAEKERFKVYEGEELQMKKHEYIEYDYLMEEVKIFDAFCGIGALHQSLKELGVPTRVVGVSEIDPDAIISYAIGHIKGFLECEFKYPAEDEMRKWLMDRYIGYSYEKKKSVIPRMKRDKLRYLYKASVMLNNLGDISKLNANNIEDFDMFNFSFSCVDLSNSGKQRGLRNADGTPTRSGLYIYGMNIIKAKKPKYIMIENVQGLIQKKFIEDFYSIVDEISELGYKCYYPKKEDDSPKCLNAKDFGVPQNRQRIFVICVREDEVVDFEFPQGFDLGIRLKHILEEEVEEKYYLSETIQERLVFNGKEDIDHNELNIIATTKPEQRTIGQRDLTYGVNGIMSTLVATDYKQPKQIVDRERTARVRKLTPKECWRLQGFRDEYVDACRAFGISDTHLYKQAGNSIAVPVLYYIFKNLFKKYII